VFNRSPDAAQRRSGVHRRGKRGPFGVRIVDGPRLGGVLRTPWPGSVGSEGVNCVNAPRTTRSGDPGSITVASADRSESASSMGLGSAAYCVRLGRGASEVCALLSSTLPGRRAAAIRGPPPWQARTVRSPHRRWAPARRRTAYALAGERRRMCAAVLHAPRTTRSGDPGSITVANCDRSAFASSMDPGFALRAPRGTC